MTRAAVPQYVEGFDQCPPGHRFNLYFEIWKDNWDLDKTGKTLGLRQTLSCTAAASLLDSLRYRQHKFVVSLAEPTRYEIDVKSTSPFTTGLGLEHPIENGFAFLTPYGLPYLAGSGVKGVLRRAAQELCDAGDTDIDSASVDALFGPESQIAPKRGSLSFWDVFPKPAGNTLVVEVMTPHSSHYLQDGKAPHDAGKPNPIPFLAVPAGSEFRFIVTCEPTLLLESLRATWKSLLDRIFQHAFDWLGFGAKTAVGYGAMSLLSANEVARARAESEASSLRCEWVDITIREIAAKNRAPETETLRGKALAEAWAALTDQSLRRRALADIRARWQEKGWWESPPGGSSKKAKQIYD